MTKHQEYLKAVLDHIAKGGKMVFDRRPRSSKRMTTNHNKDKRINFGVCYMNERYLWGYEVVDTIDNFRIKSDYGFETMESARASGLYAAKEAIYRNESRQD